jgi:hypothetical protein
MFCPVIEASKVLLYPWLEQKCPAESYCQLQLHLYFVMKITKGKPWQNSGELCGMKSTRMPLPGSWIFATYLLK